MITSLNLEGLKISLFRDDLFPFIGGGNKARKMFYIADNINKKGCNAVVTTGGIQSNHCRVVALMSAHYNWKCRIVYHGRKERFFNEKGNSFLVRKAGVEVTFVNPEEISSTMDATMDEFRNLGLNPYYIDGGGHSIEGGEAYIEVIKHLKHYNKGKKIDYIILPSGTGSTHAGILAGLDKYGFKETKVIGISVAREKVYGEKIIKDFYKKLKKHFSINTPNREVQLKDDWLCGGYEKYNSKLINLIDSAIKSSGVFFDYTYSGKALMGAADLIRENQISGNILFWHTGGLLNGLA